MKIKNNLLIKWEEANRLAKKGEIEKADESLDWCLLYLAKATERRENFIYGEKIDIWKMRVWNKIEELGLLPT
jgi:hypothetical protein